MLHRATRYTLVLGLLAMPAVASAQAFGLNEIGSCAIAKAFANTAASCDDASTIFWNPGKQPVRRGLSILAGAAAISLDGDFTQDTTGTLYKADVATALVPHVFVNYKGAGRMSYGVGLYVPYGLTSQWGEGFPGNFSAMKAALQTVYVQPNISYAINDRWSVGGGPVLGHSKIELIQSQDLSSRQTSATGPTFGQLGIPKGTEFARAYVEGDGNALGVNLGVQGKLSPSWEMGLRFLSQLSFDYEGDARFEQRQTGLILAAGNPLGAPAGTPVDALVAPQFATGGQLVNQGVASHITHPAQVQLGFAYSGIANTTLNAEYAYVGWKAFKELPVTFLGAASANSRVLQEDYGNTSSIRLSGERRMTSGVALRAGFSAATSAAPDETVTPLLPEQDRSILSLGAGLPIGSRFVMDASYARILTGGRRGRLDERATGSTATQAIALNNGIYALTANIFAVSLKATY